MENMQKMFYPNKWIKILDTISAIEANKDFSNPTYMRLLTPHFYEQHICRFPADEWPDPVKRTFKHLNSVIYTQMQGPSEFGIAGNLANWMSAIY
jgi:proline iminopeptidase